MRVNERTKIAMLKVR